MLVIHDVNNALRAFFATELYTYNVPLELEFSCFTNCCLVRNSEKVFCNCH